MSKVSFFILDEADRMLDMGFSDDIMQIVKYLPKERQTIMFSATMPAKIQQLAKTILNNPVEIKLAVSKPAERLSKRLISVMNARNWELFNPFSRSNTRTCHYLCLFQIESKGGDTSIQADETERR